jgi:hypothetical protein
MCSFIYIFIYLIVFIFTYLFTYSFSYLFTYLFTYELICLVYIYIYLIFVTCLYRHIFIYLYSFTIYLKKLSIVQYVMKNNKRRNGNAKASSPVLHSKFRIQKAEHKFF